MEHKFSFKRLLSLLVVCAMLLSSFTFLAFAEEPTNVALGKTTIAPDALGGYNAQLTDGVKDTAMAYGGDKWYAFKSNPSDGSGNLGGERTGSVKIDLDGTFELTEVKIHTIANDGSGISPASAANVYLSTDEGKTWGEPIALPVTAAEDVSTNTAYYIAGEVSGTANFVKVELTMGEKTFLFFNEIEVYGVEAKTEEPAPESFYWAEGEYDVADNGNITPHHAWGYEFTLDTVNSITGNTTALFTTEAAYVAGNVGKYSTKVVLAPTDDANVYTVEAAHMTTGKKGDADVSEGIISFEGGKLVLVVQDAGTRPEKDENGNLKFPNWEERAAAWGLISTIGAKVTLANIDIAAGTHNNGTITVEDKPVDKVTIEISGETNVIGGIEAAEEKLTDGDWALDAEAWGGNTDGVVLIQNTAATDASKREAIYLIYEFAGTPEAYNTIKLGLYSSVESMIGFPTEEDVYFSNTGEDGSWVSGYDDIGYGETIPDAYTTFDGDPTKPGTVIAEVRIKEPVTYKFVKFRLRYPESPFTEENGYTNGTAKPRWEFFGLTEIAFENVEVSSVITDFNASEYWESRFGRGSGSFGYTDADAYAVAWDNFIDNRFTQVAFAPVDGAENAYEVVNKANGANAFEFPEGGFIWLAFTNANANSAAKAAIDLFGTMSVGDVYEFTGFDFENGFVKADATITEYVDPNAPVNVLLGVSFDKLTGTYYSYGDVMSTDGSELTDGYHITADNYVAPIYKVDKVAGFGGLSGSTLELEGALGGTYAIDKIAVYYANGSAGSGICEPGTIKAFYKNGDGEWVQFGETFVSSETDDNQNNNTFVISSVEFTVDEAVKATDIRFEMAPRAGKSMVFISELEAWGKAAEADEPEVPFEYPEGYIVVDGESGKWQADEGDFDFGYNYAVDGDNLVVNVIVNDDLVEAGEADASGNGKATNIRLWVNTGAAKWDRLYDGFIKAGVAGLYSKNSAGVEGTAGTIAYADGVFTFTIPLAELAGDKNEFQFTICVSNTTEYNVGNACLYAFCETFAWSAWDAANAHTIVVKEAEPLPDVVEIKVSHVNAYNWGTFEAMIITGDGKTVEEVIGQKPQWWIVYTVENVDGKYVATNFLKNSEDCYKVTVPTGGFLFYVFDANSAYAAADEEKLLGYTFVVDGLKLDGVTAIDTTLNAPKLIYAYAPGVEIPEPEPAPVTSQVVNGFNVSHYNDGSEGSNGAFIFTDATAYNAGSQFTWWRHVSFAPSADVEGYYEVVAITNGEGGESGGLEIAEGGFIWIAFEWPAEGSGAYALSIMNTLAKGDLVKFNGVDIANCTTTEDASVEKYVAPVDPNAPVNVALGKDYVISGCGTPYAQYQALLTDGQMINTVSYDANWFTFYCNGNDSSIINAPDHIGYVIIDLGALYDVSTVKAHIIAPGVSGIKGPKSVKAYFSADNENWSEAYVLDMSAFADPAAAFYAVAEAEAQAQYVKVEFELDGVFAFVNEIEVYGEEAATEPVEPELPEDAIILDYAGYVHDSFFEIVAGDNMTVADLTALGIGASKDMNYFYVVVVDANNVITETYFALGRPDGVKSEVVCPEGGYILALNANKEGADALLAAEVGGSVVLYNIDVESFRGAEGSIALENAGFVLVPAPEAPELPGFPENITVWGSGATIDVLLDGYNGVDEVTKWEDNQSKLYGISNSILDATTYSFTVELGEASFDCITLYALDYANGGVMLPEAVTFIINGVEYEAAIYANANNIAAIEAILDEVVTASEITVLVEMGASPYSFGIFNMFTELELLGAPAPVEIELVEGDNDITVPAVNSAIAYTDFDKDLVITIKGQWSVSVIVNGTEYWPNRMGVLEAQLPAGENTVEFVNAAEDDATFVATLAVAVHGDTMDDPIIIEQADGTNITATINDSYPQGVYYTYYATQAGTVTIKIISESGWTYCINNLTTYKYGDTHWFDDEEVVASETIEVSAGDEITIVINTYDPNNMWGLTPGTVEFQLVEEALPEDPVTSNVVTDFNPVSYKESIGGATGAFIYDDADIYAACKNDWWIHVAFAPVAGMDGYYEVVGVRAPTTGNYLAMPEDGFIWMAWSSAGDTPESAGAYALAFMSNLKVGDIVKFTGVDFANHTTAADASAELYIDPNAPVNVALGKDYTLSGAADSTYNANLTDGNAYAGMSYDGKWFTFNKNNTVDGIGYAIIDLDGTYTISKLAVNLINESVSGVAKPEYVKFYVSEDGENWTEVGAVELQDVQSAAYFASLEDLELVAAYVKLEMKIGAPFSFLNEIEVYGVEYTAPASTITPWGAEVDVMTDGYTGLGEITKWEGNEDKIYGFGNSVLEAAEYEFTVAIDEATFDAITLYALDYANGGVMLPEAVTFVVDGVEYEAVITPNANGIATIVAEIDGGVTASEITVKVVMGASPYTFGIFNMFTEIEVTEVVSGGDTVEVAIGDVNMDGVINEYDYILIARAILGTYTLDEVETELADANADGVIDEYDYILVARHILGTYTLTATIEVPVE